MKSYAQVVSLGSVLLIGLAIVSQLVFTVVNSTDQLLPICSDITQFFIRNRMIEMSFFSLNYLIQQKMIHVRNYYSLHGKILDKLPQFSDTTTSLRSSAPLRASMQKMLEGERISELPDASFEVWGNFLYRIGEQFFHYDDTASAEVYWKYALIFNPMGYYPKIQ